MTTHTMHNFSANLPREKAKPPASLRPHSLDDLSESNVYRRIVKLWLMVLITAAFVIGGVYVLIGMFGMAVDFIKHNEPAHRPSEWQRR
jgi:hypothetical protein